MSPAHEPRLIESAEEIAQKMRFARADDALGKTIFLLGAGCSVSAGIPGAAEIAQRMVETVASRHEHCTAGESATECHHALVAARLLTDRLKGVTGTSSIPEAIDWYKVYDEMFERHYTTPDDVRNLFEDLVQKAGGAINWAHLCLGEIVAQRFVSTVLTTNFDQLALSGMVRAGVIPVVCDGIESLNRIAGAPRHQQLIELHGSRHTYLLRNAQPDVAAMGDNRQAYGAIEKLFQYATTFVVVGYGGREDGVMDQLIHAAGTFRDKNLYWVNYSPDPADIGPKVRDFLATSRNARLFPGQDADHFFLDLSRFLGTGVPSALSQPLGQATRVMRDLTAAKMKDADILAEIASARSRLKRLTDADAVTAQEGDPVEAVVTRIREQRLAGNHAEAYRLAHEALSP